MINPGIGYTFSKALRAALRHDPDGLLVGEIRDNETCSLAVEAALSGHPVLATVHASDAVGVINRLVGLGASKVDLEETVQIIIVQRLARKPCVCDTSEALCVRCSGSGYYGRVAAAEIAAMSKVFFTEASDRGNVRHRLQQDYLVTLNKLLRKNHIDKGEHDRIVRSLCLESGGQGCQSFV